MAPPTFDDGHEVLAGHLDDLLANLDRAHISTGAVLASLSSVRSVTLRIGWEQVASPDDNFARRGVDRLLVDFARACIDLMTFHRAATLQLVPLERGPLGRDHRIAMKRHTSRHHEALALSEPWIPSVQASARLRSGLEAVAKGQMMSSAFVKGTGALAGYWRRVRDVALPDVGSLSAGLSAEYQTIRDVLERQDGLWLRWSNLPSDWRRIYSALDDGAKSAKELAKNAEQKNDSRFRGELAAMVKLGILDRGYTQATAFLRTRGAGAAGRSKS